MRLLLIVICLCLALAAQAQTDTPTDTATPTETPTSTATPTATSTGTPAVNFLGTSCAIPDTANLLGYWSPDNFVLSDGAAITTYFDSSGVGNTGTGVNGPFYRTNVVNSLPIVRYQHASSQWFTLANNRTVSTLTQIAVVRPASYSSFGSILGDLFGGHDWSIQQFSGVQGQAVTFQFPLGTSNTQVPTSAFSIITDAYTPGTASFWFNGAPDGVATLGTFPLSTQQSFLGNAGATSSSNQSFDGDMGDVIEWKVVLSDADRCAAIACLGTKYGLTITDACATPTHTPTGPAPTATRTPTVTGTPASHFAGTNCTIPNAAHVIGYWSPEILGLGDGQPVVTYPDSSTAGNTGSGVNNPVFRASVVNGNGIVRYAHSSKQWFQLANQRTTQALTQIAVINPSSYGSYGSILADQFGGHDWAITQLSGVQQQAKAFVTLIGHSNTAVPTGAFSIVADTYSSPSAAFWLNGAANGTASVPVVFDTGTSYLGNGGSTDASNQAFDGDMGDVIEWDQVLTPTDRCAAIACLAAKYNLTNSPAGDCPGANTPTPTPTAGAATMTPTVTPTSQFILSTFHTDRFCNDNAMSVFVTTDGVNFSVPPGVTNPVFYFFGPNGTGLSTCTAASSLMHYNNKFWVAYEINDSGGYSSVGIANADNLGGPYSWVTDVYMVPSPGHAAWNPRWFVDDDGSIHLLANGMTCISNCLAAYSAGVPVMVDALNPPALTSWSAPTTLTGGFNVQIFDTFLMPPSQSPDGLYSLWYSDFTAGFFVSLAESASRMSGYIVQKSGDWAGWGTMQGPMLKHLGGANWRIYMDQITPQGQPVTGLHHASSANDWGTFTGLNTLSVPGYTPGTGSIMQEVPVQATFTPSTPGTTPTPTRTPTSVPADANSCCQSTIFGAPVCVAPPPTRTPGQFWCGAQQVIPDAVCISSGGGTGSCATFTPTPLVGTPTMTPTPTLGPNDCCQLSVAGQPLCIAPPPIEAVACCGDCNNEGRVTAADVTQATLIKNGSAPLSTCPAADCDHSGTVDAVDMGIILGNFANGCPTGTGRTCNGGFAVRGAVCDQATQACVPPRTATPTVAPTISFCCSCTDHCESPVNGTCSQGCTVTANAVCS